MPNGFSARFSDLGKRELARVLQQLCDAIEAEESSLLIQKDRDHLGFFASTNPALAGGAAPAVPIASSFTGLAFRSGQTIALADAAHQPGHFKAVDALVERPTREFAAVPMVGSGGAVVGVLTLANRRESPSPRAGQPFSPADLGEAERTVADLAGAAALLAAFEVADTPGGPAAPDPDIAAEIAALGARDRLVVRTLVAALIENRSHDDDVG